MSVTLPWSKPTKQRDSLKNVLHFWRAENSVFMHMQRCFGIFCDKGAVRSSQRYDNKIKKHETKNRLKKSTKLIKIKKHGRH